ncbi:MAG: hypothetical protein RL095_1493 [Verrucomicrobiota bacterium]|jgi:hypothetical protein
MLRLALLVALSLFACTPVKDAEAAWARAKVDESLCGTWKGDKAAIAVTLSQDKDNPRLLIWQTQQPLIAAKVIPLPDGQFLLLIKSEGASKNANELQFGAALDLIGPELKFLLLEKTIDKNIILKNLSDEALKTAVTRRELEGYDEKAGLPLTDKNLTYLNSLATKQPAAWNALTLVYVREK